MDRSRYILIVLPLLRKDVRFFLAGTLLAVALRLLFVLHFPAVVDDSRLYADIAMNWLQYGVYGVSDSGQVVPTLSRLPGYPAFLAAVFAIFGWSNFRAVLLTQVVFDLGTCFLVADIARRMFSDRAAKAAFMLAALCPFLANYSAAALTETLEIFFTAFALDLVMYGFVSLYSADADRSRILPWVGAGVSVGCCILFRPDGGILLAAIGGYLLWLLMKETIRPNDVAHTASISLAILRAGVIVAAAALAMLVPWTLRNWHTLHHFQPLAPRYANDADEPAMPGFNRWTKTWIAEFVSVQEIYWNVPGEEIDVNRLPRRAFDSPQQKQETEELFAGYNEDHEIYPELDTRFAELAIARIHAAPLRYYLWLPALRIADMWLRPRTELLPSDPRWWEFNDERPWLAVSIAFGLVNFAYLLMAVAGWFSARAFRGAGLLIVFFALRSVFLGTLENPEPRYTLECYPVILVLSAIFLARRKADQRSSNP